MRFLERQQRRFETRFGKADGTTFRGVYLALPPTVSSSALAEPRHALRVTPDQPVCARDVVTNAAGVEFLVGDHDQVIDGPKVIRRVHTLLRVTSYVTWEQAATVIDPVTQMSQDAGMTNKGMIAVSEELIGSLERDRGSNLRFDQRHLYTGAPLQLGDIVDGKSVQRLVELFGLTVVEVA